MVSGSLLADSTSRWGQVVQVGLDGISTHPQNNRLVVKGRPGRNMFKRKFPVRATDVADAELRVFPH